MKQLRYTQPDEIGELLTTPEAAAILRLTPQHLERMRSRGGGPRYTKLGRSVRYPKIELAAYVAARTKQSTSDGD